MVEFEAASWLKKGNQPIKLSPLLENVLDRGEASVIQLALDLQIPMVCIDETAGRRIARLCGLKLTGSVGILVRAKKEKRLSSVTEALNKMEMKGIWLSERVKAVALRAAKEAE